MTGVNQTSYGTHEYGGIYFASVGVFGGYRHGGFSVGPVATFSMGLEFDHDYLMAEQDVSNWTLFWGEDELNLGFTFSLGLRVAYAPSFW